MVSECSHLRNSVIQTLKSRQFYVLRGHGTSHAKKSSIPQRPGRAGGGLPGRCTAAIQFVMVVRNTGDVVGNVIEYFRWPTNGIDDVKALTVGFTLANAATAPSVALSENEHPFLPHRCEPPDRHSILPIQTKHQILLKTICSVR